MELCDCSLTIRNTSTSLVVAKEVKGWRGQVGLGWTEKLNSGFRVCFVEWENSQNIRFHCRSIFFFFFLFYHPCSWRHFMLTFSMESWSQLFCEDVLIKHVKSIENSCKRSWRWFSLWFVIKIQWIVNLLRRRKTGRKFVEQNVCRI